MFYSSYVLAKKGALGRIWLAAHWDRKLTKAQIFQTDLEMAIKNIMNPEIPMALRMSGHLLLGVARIYARKVKYLLIDCNDALIKIKMAFKPGEAQIDLQPQEMVANYAAITLPETLGEFEITLPEITLEELPIPDEKDLVSVNIAKKKGKLPFNYVELMKQEKKLKKFQFLIYFLIGS
jgi:cohesin complex subunit SCC1